MVEEDKVSYDLAIMLRDKGFNEPCLTLYNVYGALEVEFGYSDGSPLCNSDSDVCLFIGDRCDNDSFMFVTAPTYGHVMKWLREVYNIFISIDIYSKDLKGNIRYCADIYKYGSRMILDTPIVCDTYEEVCETACIYVLKNLI